LSIEVTEPLSELEEPLSSEVEVEVEETVGAVVSSLKA
jgi:hypothetical protein